MIGSSLSHYKLLEKVGEGGMGVVYKARDILLNRLVAVKLIPAGKTSDDQRKRWFLQEARTASGLNHPNIITIYELGEADGQDFIAMEYVAGKTLDQVVPRGGMPVTEALRAAIQIAAALAAAHAAGVVHRDLKPSNVMLTDSGQVKVLDFGVAKLTESMEDATEILSSNDWQLVVGTPAYMSPEQIQGKPIDPRSDVFAFGIMLYEMLAGHRPFEGSNALSPVAAMLHNEPKSLTDSRSRIPAELERIVMRCLRKERERRFQTMADLKVALEEIKDETDSGIPVVLPPPKRVPIRTIAALSAVIAVVGLSGLWLASRRHPLKREPVLIRLTTGGHSFGAQISSDGKLVAYRAMGDDSVMNIWVRHVSGEATLQVTHEPENVVAFALSPDGSRIAYSGRSTSHQDQYQPFEVPVFGGRPRRLGSSDEINLRYLPDGSALLGTDWETSELLSISHGDSTPKRVRPGFHVGCYAVSPDSRRVLMTGLSNWNDNADLKNWWMLSLANGALTKVPGPTVREEGENAPCPNEWIFDRPSGADRVLYTVENGSTGNLFYSVVDANLRFLSEPQALTSSTNWSGMASAATTGDLVFTSGIFTSAVMLIPADANRARITGEAKAVVSDEQGVLSNASMSRDGKALVYVRRRTQPRRVEAAIWLRNLETGEETELARGQSMIPSIAPDGLSVAFQRRLGNAYEIVVARRGAMPRVIAKSDAFAGVRGFSRNGRFVLIQNWVDGESARVGRIDLTTGEMKDVLAYPGKSVWHPYYSRDDKWMTFKLELDSSHHQLFITPVKEYVPEGRRRWIPLTTGKYWDDKPQLSPDGNTLYFTSNRDGFNCIWAERLNPLTKYPVGQPFAVQHFHTIRYLTSQEHPLIWMDIQVATDKLIALINDARADIWMMRYGSPE